MNIRKIIEKRFRHQGDGVNAAGDVRAVISANVGTGPSRSHVSTKSSQRIVQRSGRSTVSEKQETIQGEADNNAAGGTEGQG